MGSWEVLDDVVPREVLAAEDLTRKNIDRPLRS